ncbi:hypothetical protein GCM10022223_52670 [Kineosporia mesophila]|uniref:Uncharacterized protein n=1 Tax=Kineosporia mesophila TaxID=566012 RepID=A0ABP7ABQ1_9ACTN|nr:hypothetical protein [Kineosporia mesophila]MCD5351349.1 hypothetical protein [Kineosporia mesophila]
MSDDVVVVAPEKAARVTVTAQGAQPSEFELQSGIGTVSVDPNLAGTATAYAEDGSALGSTPIRWLASPESTIGDTPQTRAMP